MATIARKNIAAGTANALTGLPNNTVGPDGAFVSLFGSTPAAGGTMTLKAEGGNLLLSDLAAVNIEAGADDVEIPNDCVVLNEPVDAGELFLSVDAQIGNFIIFITDQEINI